MSRMTTKSNYLVQLEREHPDVADRYRNKIRIINNVDPFALKKENLEYGIDSAPPVSSIDIVSYLVLTHSFYTKEQMKAFKSLNAYKYFEAGFVQVGCIKINDLVVMVGNVKHSQRANEKPVDTWVITEGDGSVSTAHCTCMAGNSEVCSHVGAILYHAEYATNIRKTTSCTDMKSAWPVPAAKQVPIVPVATMDWGSSVARPSVECPPLSASDLIPLLKTIEEAGCSSAVMRIVEPFASAMSCNKANIPYILNIYNEEYAAKDYEELCNMSEDIIIHITSSDCKIIEEITRSQSCSEEWYVHRAGRITASKFKSVCVTNIKKPSLSLIKSICYPKKVTFNTKATRWGIMHEDVAVKKYQSVVASNHASFEIKQVGFVIDNLYPAIGASPDRVVCCECCNSGCVEVKCPYLLHANNVTIKDFANMKDTCLVVNKDKIQLDRKHAYYYQVQLQMLATKTMYCDFVVWSPIEIYIERIIKDEEFLRYHLEVALHFHKKVILPELLGKCFTRKDSNAAE